MSLPFQPAGNGRRVFQAPKNLAPSADLTPLIDVVFQLLLFFMLSSTFIKPALDIDLPKASMGAPPGKVVPLVLTVSADRAMDLNGELISEHALAGALSAALAAREGEESRAITLRADAALPYGEVVRVMDTAKRAGASNLKLEYTITK